MGGNPHVKPYLNLSDKQTNYLLCLIKTKQKKSDALFDEIDTVEEGNKHVYLSELQETGKILSEKMKLPEQMHMLSQGKTRGGS